MTRNALPVFLSSALISVASFFITASVQAQPGGSSARDIPTEVQKSEGRVDQIIERANDHFRKGKLNLEDNKREQARDEFDKAVDEILMSGMTRNVVEAEDLAQEVFIQLFRKIGSFRGESAFTTWLHRLTVNQVLMHFRKRGVRLEQTTEEGEVPVQIVKGTENPNAMPVVDRIALDKAIAQLPPGYRTVFTLHDIEGHEHEEIARMSRFSIKYFP